MTILSYLAQFFNASCLRYFKKFCRWFALRELCDDCNYLIISSSI